MLKKQQYVTSKISIHKPFPLEVCFKIKNERGKGEGKGEEKAEGKA